MEIVESIGAIGATVGASGVLVVNKDVESK